MQVGGSGALLRPAETLHEPRPIYVAFSAANPIRRH